MKLLHYFPALVCLLTPVFSGACDLVALIARDGNRLVDVSQQAAPLLEFMIEHAAPPNNDGYGLVYYGQSPLLAENQRYYASGQGDTWYHNNDQELLDQALDEAFAEGSASRLMMIHARNGTGGRGSHPFVIHRGDRSFSFMHNGDLTDGTDWDMKESLLAGLESVGWFDGPNGVSSNWEGLPGDVSSWVDTELLFHYIMYHIEMAEGDVIHGLHAALNERDWFGFDVLADISSEDSARNPGSVINFVLSDGDALYAYKNANDADQSHELAWREEPVGMIGLKTENAAGFTPLGQYELVTLRDTGAAERISNLHQLNDAQLVDDLSILGAYPNPFNPATTLQLLLAEAGPIRFSVFNLTGQLVARPFDGLLGAGEQRLTWSGRTDLGLPLPSGNYFCVLEGRTGQDVVKVLLLR